MALLREAPSPTDRSPTSSAAKASLAASTLALVISGYTLVQIASEPDLEQLDRRIACLEKDGANDCGVDGR